MRSEVGEAQCLATLHLPGGPFRCLFNAAHANEIAFHSFGLDLTPAELAALNALTAQIAALHAEVARLEAEVARLRPLAAPVWPDSPAR